MELNFGLGRLALFAVLLGGFTLLGGFSAPEPQEQFDAMRVAKAQKYCVILFLAEPRVSRWWITPSARWIVQTCESSISCSALPWWPEEDGGCLP